MSPATPNPPARGPAAPEAAADLKLVADILIQLNILRKNCKIYPDGHPALQTSVGRAAKLLQAFHAKADPLALTVGRHTLQLGKQPLPAGNPIVAEYAAHLRDQSIVSLSLKRGITEDGLIRTSRLLSGDLKGLPPGTSLAEAIVHASGGHAEVRLLDLGGSEFTDVAEIDLSARTAAGAADSSWDAFIRRLLQRGDDALLGGEEGVMLSAVGAEKLAALADRLEADQGRLADRAALAEYAQDGGEADAPRGRLLRLASSLAPPLKAELTRPSRWLAAGVPKAAEALLNDKAVQLALCALERVNAEGPPVDARVVAVADALAGSGWQAPGWPAPLQRPSQEREFAEHVRAFLTAGGFPPPPDCEDPGAALRKLEDDLRVRTGPAATGANLLAGLPGLSALEHFATTHLDLLAQAADPAVAEARARTLAGLIASQAAAGNWGLVLIIWRGLGEIEAQAAADNPTLAELCRQAKTQSWNPEDHPRLAVAVLSYGLDKADYLSDILRVTGRTQAQLIVEAYAVETREAAQSALLPLIVDMKEQTMPHVLRLLDDTRPPVICRMLQLVQKFGDPAPLRTVEALAARADTNVKLDALRTLAILGSPKAPALLLRAIAGPDETLSVGAIAAARLLPRPEISRALLDIVRAPRWFKRSFDTARKIEAVRSLIGMRQAELLSEVCRIIGRRPLFHAGEFRRLRVEAFRALIHADTAKVGDFLKLGRSLGEPEIAGICKELERRVRAGAPPRQGGPARTAT